VSFYFKIGAKMTAITSSTCTTRSSSQEISEDILNHPDRRLRLPEVKALTGYSTASIYSKMNDGTFPISKKMGGRAVSWRLGDILEFVNNCPLTIEKLEVA
jgi:prophage regulatory protein